jgi:peroxiredoxin (alkyl hydroperoxide reductase subunit C)
MESQLINGMPRIGDEAPDFEALTTIGNIKFSDYNKGSWVVFFSHPADFTPVCTTEMSGFAKRERFLCKTQYKINGFKYRQYSLS